jgi:hypothetical protein
MRASSSAFVWGFPPPLRGRDKEGGIFRTHERGMRPLIARLLQNLALFQKLVRSGVRSTPLPTPPPQGARERTCLCRATDLSQLHSCA